MRCKTVAVNAGGALIGESHQWANLTDREIDRMRQLHEADGWSYERLAEAFEVSKGAVAKICRYERRAQIPERYKEVPVSEEDRD